MEPVIVQVAEAVEIAAPPDAVFAVVSDPLAKARLNPSLEVIRVEREDPGPLREGSVTFLRLQKGRRIFEYRARCERLEPGRVVEHRAELPTLVRVRAEVEPIPAGARLTQHEECEITLAMVEDLPTSFRVEWAWRAMKALNFLFPELAWETVTLILRERADGLRLAMQRELRAWLEAIKRHIESAEGKGTPALFASTPGHR